MHQFRLWTFAALIGIGALLLAGPTLAQDPVPPEDPPGTASGRGMQFVVTYEDSVHFTVTTTDSVEAVIHAFSTTTLDIVLEGIGGVTSTQVTIAGFVPEVTLHLAVDDLRNDTVFTADAAGVYSFTQDLSAPRHVMIKPYPSTWYLYGTGWTARWQAEVLLKWGSYGSGDGKFDLPCGVAVDASGNVYVADTKNHRIQKFSATGAFLAKWGTYGSGDGQFSNPYGVVVDAGGNVYVTDFGNHRVQKFTAAGAFLAKWGSQGSGDGQFENPLGVAVDAGGNVYVTDYNNHRIQKFSATGAFLAKWGNQGGGNGQFQTPSGVAVDAGGNVYVVDTRNDRIQKFSTAGAFLAKWGSEGSGDGQFNNPRGVAVAASGDVYVTDSENNRIQKFSATGAFLAKWGSYGTGDGYFYWPYYLAVDAGSNVYVADVRNNRIQKFDPTNITAYVPGTWDPVTKTATLTKDVTETIQITGTGITLDGDGHTIVPASGDGVYLTNGSGITVRNATITASGSAYGLRASSGSDNVLEACNVTAGQYAIYASSSPRLRVTGNDVSAQRALYLSGCANSAIYNNNFYTPIVPNVVNSTGAMFNLCRPSGGNYWSGYTGIDANADRFGDTRYCFGDGWGLGQDNLPYVSPSGWTLPAGVDEPVSLVALYSFDGNADDQSASLNHPSTVNQVTYGPGFEGQAAVFNGTSSYIDIPVDIGPSSHPQITFGAWANTHVTNGLRAIISNDNCCYDRQIGLDSRWGGYGWAAFAGVTAGGGVNCRTAVPNTWTFVAVRYDGCTTTLFVDGQAYTTGETTRDGTSYARIGKNPYHDKFFDGLIDNLFIFRGALTDAQVESIRQGGLAGILAVVTPPLAIEAPADAGYACVGEVSAASPEQATVTGGQGTPTVTVSETSNEGTGSAASPLILTRTWTATDQGGQTASDAQTITVVDAVAPTLSLPAAVSVTTGPGVEPCGDVRMAVEYGAATATDACGEPTVAASGVPDGGFPVGTTTLTWTATDAVGNTSTATQTVTVTCPVGTVAGTATETCDGATTPSEAATVRLLHEGTQFRNVATGADGGYSFAEVRHGTYTVAIEPPEGYGVPTDTRLAALAGDLLEVEPFPFTCLLGDIAGTVEGTCNGTTSGLQGVTVDVYREGSQGLDVLVGTAGTNADGSFRFNNLALGEYSLSIVTPLGYAATGAVQAVSLTVPDGLVQAPAFGLACQPIVNQVRGMGYWKHQVNVYLTGKGSAQETLDQLLGYIDQMVEHFNENLVNPVIVYVPGSGNTNDKLLQLQQLLTVNRGGTTLDRAKQHLLPLLLNVVSGKISQTEVISDNGANVSQAITYCHDLIVDGIAGNDETAKTIAEKINEGQRVPSGMVPVTTRLITYDLKPAVEEAPTLRLERISPNPAQGAFTLAFSLAGSGAAWLEVVDVAGRQVLRQEVGRLGAGRHSLGSNELGPLAMGVYFIRLSEAGSTVIGRVAVVR